jgi:hypothetical protein
MSQWVLVQGTVVLGESFSITIMFLMKTSNGSIFATPSIIMSPVVLMLFIWINYLVGLSYQLCNQICYVKFAMHTIIHWAINLVIFHQVNVFPEG